MGQRDVNNGAVEDFENRAEDYCDRDNPFPRRVTGMGNRLLLLYRCGCRTATFCTATSAPGPCTA